MIRPEVEARKKPRKTSNQIQNEQNVLEFQNLQFSVLIQHLPEHILTPHNF